MSAFLFIVNYLFIFVNVSQNCRLRFIFNFFCVCVSLVFFVRFTYNIIARNTLYPMSVLILIIIIIIILNSVDILLSVHIDVFDISSTLTV